MPINLKYLTLNPRVIWIEIDPVARKAMPIDQAAFAAFFPIKGDVFEKNYFIRLGDLWSNRAGVFDAKKDGNMIAIRFLKIFLVSSVLILSGCAATSISQKSTFLAGDLYDQCINQSQVCNEIIVSMIASYFYGHQKTISLLPEAEQAKVSVEFHSHNEGAIKCGEEAGYLVYDTRSDPLGFFKELNFSKSFVRWVEVYPDSRKKMRSLDAVRDAFFPSILTCKL